MSEEKEQGNFGQFIGTSVPMQDIYLKISKLAPTEASVFIHGESGTGKEICAQMLHTYSDRKDGPFIAINCGALPHDLIESALFGHVKGAFTGAQNAREGAVAKAQSGTLFLDEIGDMPLELQVKILRFCQDYSYSKLGSDTVNKANIRIICASNKDIKAQIEKDLFREDLYHRLHMASITMPPLRERKEDILDLAYYYLNVYAKNYDKLIQGFSENVENIFLNHTWLGNVRELKNTIHQIVMLENTKLILTSMLPDSVTTTQAEQPKKLKNSPPIIDMPLWKIEKKAIQDAIALSNGDIPRAAAILDVAPSTVYRKMKLWKNSE